MKPGAPRFEALDAWRGLSAALVVLFHLQAYSHFYDLSFLRNSYLFVDFFFVLSGFVITANYRTKLLSGFSFWHFMSLRFGRLYPLHVATLAVLVAMESVRYHYDGLFGGVVGGKFVGDRSVASIVSNVFLVQGLGIHDRLTWNQPSWSISVEFYTYAVFAVAVLYLRGRTYLAAGLFIVGAPILLFWYVGHIDAQYDFGIFRCIFGFFVGLVVYDFHSAIKKGASNFGYLAAGFVEIVCVGFLFSFLSLCGEGALSLAAPLAFAAVVLVFSFEGGFVSKILKARPLMRLGLLSYSVYMTHMLVQIGMRYAFEFLQKKSGATLFHQGFFGAELWQGDLAYLICLMVVVAISCFTYSFVEKPGRWLSQRLASRLFASSERLVSTRSFLKDERKRVVTPATTN